MVPILEPSESFRNAFVCGPDDVTHELARQELVARMHTETNRLTDQRIRCLAASEKDACNEMSECIWKERHVHPYSKEVTATHCSWKGR